MDGFYGWYDKRWLRDGWNDVCSGDARLWIIWNGLCGLIDESGCL